MGTRVTWRSRPRWDGKISAVNGVGFSGFSGPFTRAQLTELIWRVKSIRLEASMTLGGEEHTISRTMTRRRRDGMNFVSDETELLAAWLPQHVNLSLWDDLSGSGTKGIFDIYTDGTNLGIDGSGDYWLGDALNISANSSPPEELSWGVYSGNTYETDVTTGLEFSDGSSVEIVLCALVPSGATAVEAELEIVEWFPYADNNGSDAWNTATGQSTNDGPGG